MMAMCVYASGSLLPGLSLRRTPRRYALMKGSSSPSSTASVFPLSTPVRTSFHPVRREHVVADLRAEGDVRLGGLDPVALRLLLAQLQLVEPRLEHLPGHV